MTHGELTTLESIALMLVKMDSKLDRVEVRLDGVDDRVGGVDQRLDGIDQKLDQLLQGGVQTMQGQAQGHDDMAARLAKFDSLLAELKGRVDHLEAQSA